MRWHAALPAHSVQVGRGRSLRVMDVGPHTAPAVVLVHGSPVHSGSFRHAILTLSSTFRVIAPDLLGFGGSSAADTGHDFIEQVQALSQLLHHLDLPRYVLVVHDWGGPAGVAAACEHLEGLLGLVLINTTLRRDFRPPWYWRPSIASGLGELLVVHANLAGLALRSLMQSTRHPDVYRSYAEPLAQRGTRKTILRLERQEGFDAILRPVEQMRDQLAERPTLILWGEPDPYFRARELSHLQALFPQAQTQVLRGAGHFPQEDAEDAVTGALYGFVKRLC